MCGGFSIYSSLAPLWPRVQFIIEHMSMKETNLSFSTMLLLSQNVCWITFKFHDFNIAHPNPQDSHYSLLNNTPTIFFLAYLLILTAKYGKVSI